MPVSTCMSRSIDQLPEKAYRTVASCHIGGPKPEWEEFVGRRDNCMWTQWMCLEIPICVRLLLRHSFELSGLCDVCILPASGDVLVLTPLARSLYANSTLSFHVLIPSMFQQFFDNTPPRNRTLSNSLTIHDLHIHGSQGRSLDLGMGSHLMQVCVSFILEYILP